MRRWLRYYLVMGNASNKVLYTVVSNVLARQMVQGKRLTPVQQAVMVRLQNALAIEQSLKALNSAESK